MYKICLENYSDSILVFNGVLITVAILNVCQRNFIFVCICLLSIARETLKTKLNVN